ncbi:MAG: asparaginase [Candidatus Eisenbacteria bacterium]
MRMHLEVQVWRGEIPESRHRVQMAACDGDGREVAGTGEANLLTTFRSAAKPFQLTPFVERGHADSWGFGPEELALMAASHTGSPRHVAGVRGLLARIGLPETALACGSEDPLDPVSLRALHDGREAPSPVFHNCSGKHAGMLALCLSEGWPTSGYERPDHPLQTLMHRTVAEICGLAVEQVTRAVDGCGVCAFAMPLTSMARGYARLASASAAGDPRAVALARIREAMRAHPWAVGGAVRFSSALMEAAPHLVSKGGAEGLECVGWPDRGLGVAVKCEDGATRAVSPAVVLVLEQLGALDPEARRRLEPWAQPVIRNAAGRDVGCLRAEIRSPVTAEN